MPDNMSTVERIDTIGSLLDKLTDAQGRAKCGYIYIINEFLNKIREDVIILEDKIKNPEVQIELDDETVSQE